MATLKKPEGNCWACLPPCGVQGEGREMPPLSGDDGRTPGLSWNGERESHSVVSDSLRPHGLYGPWNSPGQNTGVGSLSLLQGIFPTQGWNPGLLHCRLILYQLTHRGSPRILKWVTYSFSRGSSWPRNRTGVSCLAGRFFTSWATREAQNMRTSCLFPSWSNNPDLAPLCLSFCFCLFPNACPHFSSFDLALLRYNWQIKLHI